VARLVELVVPSVLSENLIAELRRIDGVITIRLQRNASLLPGGDVLQVALTNRALHPAMRLLARHGLGQDGRISASTSEPLSILSTGSSDAVLGDISEATWEEIDYVMSKESNMTLNMILVMAIAGVLAVSALLFTWKRYRVQQRASYTP
jgi:hypothetical protein